MTAVPAPVGTAVFLELSTVLEWLTVLIALYIQIVYTYSISVEQ